MSRDHLRRRPSGRRSHPAIALRTRLGDLALVSHDDDDRIDDSDDDGDRDEVSFADLNAIEESALVAKRSANVTFLAPPDVVLRLVRSHKAASTGALVERVTSSDIEGDLAERIDDLRKALEVILEIDGNDAGAARRMRAVAQKGLRHDDLVLADMVSEFGDVVEHLARYESPADVFDLREPETGQIWRDELGGHYRVVEIDLEAYEVRLEIIDPVEWVGIGDLTTYASLLEGGVDGPALED